MIESNDYSLIDYQELDQYLEVMFKLLEGFVDFNRAEDSLNNYLAEKGDLVPREIQDMMREILEEKRKKYSL